MTNLNQPTKDITPEIEAYIVALTAFNIDYAQDNKYALREYKVSYGKAYARISAKDVHGSQESAHTFVALTDNKLPLGSILKPKGWASPTLNFARGNVINGEYKIVSPYGV